MSCDVALMEILHFLSSTPKHKRVTTLQAEHRRASNGKVAEQLMDLLLCACVEALLLADIYHACPVMYQSQYIRRHQSASLQSYENKPKGIK